MALGSIRFEGAAPYGLPPLQGSEVIGSGGSVTAYLSISLDGSRPQPVSIAMQPAQALELAERLMRAAQDALR